MVFFAYLSKNTFLHYGNIMLFCNFHKSNLTLVIYFTATLQQHFLSTNENKCNVDVKDAIMVIFLTKLVQKSNRPETSNLV